jgi:hypothetical protein
MTGSILSFSAMAVAGRAVAPILDTFELMTWRSLIGFVIVVGVGGLMGIAVATSCFMRDSSAASGARACMPSTARRTFIPAS